MLLLCVAGGSVAWADGITPTTEINFRLATGKTSWTTKNAASETNNKFEINYNSGFFALQKYQIENIAAVKSLTLTLTGTDGTDAMAIWIYSTNDWSTSSDASTVATALTSIVGFAPTETGTANTTYLVNGTNSKTEVASGTNACTFTFNSTALENLKKAADADGTFTLLITNKTDNINNNTKRTYYSSGHATESYRPTLTVTYDVAGVAYADGTKTNYSSFEAARSAATTAAQDATIVVMEDQNITSRVNAISGKTLNIVAGKDDVVLTNTQSNGLAFLANASNAGTINVGNESHRLIIKNSAASTNNVVETSGGNNSAIINIENVTFSSISTSNASGIVKANDSSAKIYLKDVTFDDCSVTAENAGIVYCNANGNVTLKGNMTFTNCTGNCFKVKGRMEEDGFTPTQVMTVYSDGIALAASAIIKMNAANRDKYVLVNEDRCLVGKGSASNEELVVSEAYTLSVSAANAATLIIPFDTTIPEGVEAYTLNYTSGTSVTATAVETTLPANTPVLINAAGSAEGAKYKFNASTRATSATAATASGTHTSGALTGVYEETTVPTNSYILYKSGDDLGFYKVAEGKTNKVQAYRAYLTAEAAGARISISYGNGDTTEIDAVKAADVEATGAYYNLAGQRVTKPGKGVYIVNGKKLIVK